MFPYFYFLGRKITAYGIMMALAFVTVGVLGVLRGKKRRISVDDLLIIAAFAVGGALIGGNVLYVIVTYPPARLIQMIKSCDFSFLSGGLVFYGGLLGGILGGLQGVRLSGCDFADAEKTVVPLIPLGHGIGRIGCLLAGCCHGMRYSGPLAVYYPNSVLGLPENQGFFPVQGLEALLNIGICALLLFLEKRVKRRALLLSAYLGIYAVTRFCLEFLRGDEARGVYLGLSVSQWIAIGMFVVSSLVISAYKNPKGKV